MMEEKTFSGYDIRLNYAEGPSSGSALVLLHGGSARWQDWNNLIPQLTSKWHVYALDLRGHGKSDRASRYKLQDYAADIHSFLEKIVKEPAILFGHSLGGSAALITAAQFSKDILAVIVGDSPLTQDTFRTSIESQRQTLSSWADIAGGKLEFGNLVEELKNSLIEIPGLPQPVTWRSQWGEDHPVFHWLADNLFHNDPVMLRALLDDLESVTENYQMHTLLPQIRCPVLLLQADPEVGGVMNDVEAARAIQLLAQPSVVRLTGVGHAMHNENPQAVLIEVERFLTDLKNPL